MTKKKESSQNHFSKKAIFLLLIFILTLAAPSSALADPASFFDTDLATGISRFKDVVNDAAGGSAVFYERTFNSSMSTNVFEVQNGSGGSAWVRVTQDGSPINFDSAQGPTGYYFHDWSVGVSSWSEAYAEGITFEFFTDSGLTTPMNVNAFGIYTYHWGTCCLTSNPIPSGGTQDGTAIYSIFDADPTTYHELIGNITETISAATHFVAEIDDREEGFQKVTVIPNGDGEFFAMGGYIVFSWVAEDSVPPGSGSTPSIPPGNPDLTAPTDLGDSSTDNLTSDNTPDFEITYSPQNTIDFVNLYSSPNSSGPWTLIATSPAAGTVNQTTVTLTSTSLADGAYYIAGKVENGFWHDESDPSPSPLRVTIDTTSPSMTITSPQVSDGDTSNDSSITLNFSSSESTTNFSASDVVVTNATLSGFSGSGTSYSATLTPIVDGPVTVNVPAGSFTDRAGNDNLAPDEFNWISDRTPPTVTFNPLDGATIVANAADIILTLSEPIRRASDNAELTAANLASHITLQYVGTGSDIPFSASIDVEKKVITINPVSILLSNLEVFVGIGTSVEDFADNPLADSSASFMSADENQPTLSSSSPSDGLTNVDVDTDLVLTFSEAVDAESGNIEIRLTNNNTLFESIPVTSGQVSGSGTDTITVDISGPLASLTDYYVLIDSTAFDDADSNSYQGIADSRTLNFETEFIDTYPPNLTFNPVNGSADVPVGSNITITFDEPIRNLDDSPITDSNVDGLITLKDTNASGANISFDATIDGTKQVITINPTSNFSSGQVVYAAIGPSVEDLYNNAISGDNTTFTVEDNVAPILLSTSPADESTTVAADDDLILYFSEPVFVQFGTIKIYNAADDSIFESMSVTSVTQVSGSGTSTITVTPNNSFDYNSSYYVQIDATAFDDASGNSYAGISNTTDWNFTTLPLSGTITCSAVSIATNEDTSGSVTANCTGSGLSYSTTQPLLGISSEVAGSLIFNPNGEYEFLGQGETDTTNGDFTYTANDGSTVSAAANVQVTVTGVNDPPTANDDAVSTNEDTPFTTIDLVAANDVDPDTSDSLSVISINTTGTTGDVTDNGNGTFTYDPNGQFDSLAAGESAADTFSYLIEDGFGQQDTATVTVTVMGVNDAPTAGDDTTAGTDEDTAFRTANLVAANDTDPDTSDTLSVVALNTSGTIGIVVNNGNGTFDYYPAGNFDYLDIGDIAVDTFVYTVSDGNGGLDTATVSVNVTGINDAPSISSCTITPVTAYADSDLSTNYSGWNDPEGDPANVNFVWTRNSIILPAYNGSSTLPASELTKNDLIELDCTPEDSHGLSGTTLSDSLTITNSPPIAQPDFPNTPEDTAINVDVLDNDSDADTGDTITIISVTHGSDGSVTNNGTDLTYDPDPNFFGTDSFDYTIEDDDGETDTTTVTITVSEETNMEISGNGQPIANGDSTPSPSDHTDFGTTSLFPGTVTRSFTITNQGLIDLALNGTPRVEITGAHSGDFTVTSLPATPLSSGATTTFEIEFDPSAAGLREATVNVETDDLSAPYTFDIEGTASRNDSDNDGMMDNDEQGGDRDSDGVANYLDYDPTGYFYDEANGEIISGGRVNASGPGVITTFETGASGYYQFSTDGTAGTYILTVTLPPGYDRSKTCLQGDPPPYDPTGNPDPDVLGAGEDGNSGFLTSKACTAFYLTLDLEAGDPFIINNNIPLRRLPLPDTGFVPGQITELVEQPADKTYQKLSGFWLDVPGLNLQTPLVGVPTENGEWDVTWLGNNAGYLMGSAFPTWEGNTVITGHVWNADNQPGIFVDLKTLAYGDEIRIHAWGEIYTYEVTANRRVSPYTPNVVFEHKEGDWITLFTCEDYGEYWGDYGYRRMVQAVLVRVSPEN